MTAHAIARQFFAPPGGRADETRHLLAQAAAAHAQLLNSAVCDDEPLAVDGATIGRFLRSPAPARDKRLLLDDPRLVEALHSLAAVSHRLAKWDALVAPGCQLPVEQAEAVARGRLATIAAGIALRQSRRLSGRWQLATDAYGRVRFACCDWALVLVDGQGELLTHCLLTLDLDDRRTTFCLAGREREPLVVMPRHVFDAMLIENRADLDSREIEFCAAGVHPRFERAACLGATPIRYQPIAAAAPGEHAETTGAILACLLRAIEHNAPGIHQQMCQCIRAIQGFELPAQDTGQIASFSLPTSPGLIGFNVVYTPRGEPRLSPYCFLWLGHELGHTLHYLIDSVAYAHGWRFLENPGEWTPVIPRYGRGITVRTLFQIPYVHLYEWWLLIRFQEQNFAGLTWSTFDDALAVGRDLRDEIEESFDLIDEHARLTVEGNAVTAQVRRLAADALAHWRRVTLGPSRPRHAHKRA